jgi:non-lysosomal glucosylceramidase
MRRISNKAGFRTAALAVVAFIQLGRVGPAAAFASQAGDSLKRDLLTRHAELLMEKGICDSSGREIAGRLDELLRRAPGRESTLPTLSGILKKLNYAPSNLGGFPPCAFDRPIGHSLSSFGHTITDGDIDADAEGSACPAGGLGAGAYEWTMSGHFKTWFLKPGWHVDETVWADAFHVFMKSGRTTIARTLATGAPPDKALGAWAWNYPAGAGSYYALFPKAGFSYESNPDFPVKLAVTQFSPVIPGNYQETSFPVAVYKWIASNPGRRPAQLSVMLTWENMVGWSPRLKATARAADFGWDRRVPGRINEVVRDGRMTGIVFCRANQDPRTGNAMSGTMCLAAESVPGKAEVFVQADFDPRGDGADVWATFAADGTLSGSERSRTTGAQDALGGALAVRLTLAPGERVEFPIVLAWDFPYAEFEPGVRHPRKYTAFFGESGLNAAAIAREALANWRGWERAVDDWQRTIVADPELPDWFKQALINELYILPETSIWDASTNLHTYLESADYLMYGTFDVDSYCWHILKLWPELEIENMRYFSRTVDLEDASLKAYQYAVQFPNEVPPDKRSYYWSTNKTAGMVPHDIGSPRKRPWVVLNAFDWQNGNVWKDLNPKFPLRGLRAYEASGRKDDDLLKRLFRASVLALDTLERRFADPHSHLPRNEGIPDQTYDTWRMKGETAYVGMLWLAALKAAAAMGEDCVARGMDALDGVPVRDIVAKYRAWFETGRPALQKLWNEKTGCFNIDAETDDIMTDQLFGAWYATMLGLEGNEDAERIIPRDQLRRALRTVYEKNVLGFGGGLLGAVNGRTSAGAQLFSQQGDEVWVGTAYAFAANLVLNGMREEGLRTAYGLFHVVYSPFGQGYFFKTPEAYLNPDELFWNDRSRTYGDRLFRAMKYMRPGAVWAVYEALLMTRGAR